MIYWWMVAERNARESEKNEAMFSTISEEESKRKDEQDEISARAFFVSCFVSHSFNLSSENERCENCDDSRAFALSLLSALSLSCAVARLVATDGSSSSSRERDL